MIKFYKRMNIKYMVIFILLICFISTVVFICFTNKVEAQEGSYTVTQPDGTQIVYSWDNTEIIQIKYDKRNKAMIITGKHKRGDGIVYRTSGFTITKGETNKQITSYNGGKTTILKGQGLTVSDKFRGDTTTTTYTIDYDTLYRSLVQDLGYNATQLKDGVDIYLSNVFRVANRVGTSTIDKSNYDYLNYASDGTSQGKGIVDAEYWSSAAKEYLKNYYDIKVHVQLIPNKYKIVYVDSTDETNILKTVATDKDIVLHETYTHTPSETITSDDKTYKYASKYKVVYDNGVSTNKKNWPLSSGSISITHSQISDATLMVYYEEDISDYEYDVVVSYVNEDGEEIAEDKNAGKFKKGEIFSFVDIRSPITYQNTNYEYNETWSYSYKGTDNNTYFEDNLTDPNYPYFDSLPDVKQTYKLYITLYYKEGNGGIDITPIPEEPDPDPTPSPTIPPVEVPIPETVEEVFPEVVATGQIEADDRGSQKFFASLGIPTTESLYGEVKSTEYLLGYNLTKKVGTKTYAIRATKKYHLVWNGETDEETGITEQLEDTVEVTQIINVERAYGYWEIAWLDYYTIANSVLNNYALPNGSLTLTPNYSYYTPPNITYNHSSAETDHIIPPSQYTNGIELPAKTLTGGDSKPTIPDEDFTWDVNSMTDKIKVKSDYLAFNGNVVMSNAPTEIEAPHIITSNMLQCTTKTNENVLYKNNQIIEATKDNGTYASTGTISYTRNASVNSRYNNILTYNVININNVVIHTPVYCKPSITGDNNKYVQLIKPNNNCVQLVLDENHTLNDMIVSISNTGQHSDKPGYFFRDFSKSLRDPNVSYIASSNGVLRNEVKFPFDVYLDIGNDMDESNDKFVKADTWIVIGRSSPRVYLPMWVKEGVHTVNFRTVAVNVGDRIRNTEAIANTNLINYVATDSIDVEVSGRLFGLTLYDVTDYPMWKEVFRVFQSTKLKRNTSAYRGTTSRTYNKDYIYDYTVGIMDRYGNITDRDSKYTIPLVNGSHPQYTNIGVLKTGYAFRFKLDAIGDYYNTTAYVKIKPNFYHVDANGNNRVSVDLYYDEPIYNKSRKLVKVGGSLDAINLKTIKTGDAALAIPDNELKDTAAIMGSKYSRWISQVSAMFNFAEIKLKSPFRTFTNTDYVKEIVNSNQSDDIFATGIKQEDIMKRRQSYYGEYYLPGVVHVAPKGYDVYDYASKYGVDYNEDFWLTDGYIIINFDIIAVDNDGKERLSYVNSSNYLYNGNCSMWVMEGASPTKIGNDGIEFNFKAGDFMMYYTDQSIRDDYEVGGTH